MDEQKPTSGLSSAENYHPHHYHLRRTTQRLKHLIHPNGRRVHVVQTPAEAEELKRSISHGRADEVEICLSGTEEHLEVLRSIHAHHDEMRNELRERYGEAFDQAEMVILEMEALSDELKHLNDRAVQFDPSFNKYGYSANIRTHGDSPQHSSSVSVSSGKTGQQALEDWHALKFQGQPMKVWRKPVLRQYLHDSLLWRNQEEEEVASYELFLDLIYVGIIAISGDSAAEQANGSALLRFAISFIMGWKIWSDVMQLINWFDQDDLIRRLYVLFTLASLVGFTTNITEYASTTYTPFVAFYLAARLAAAAYYLWMAWIIPMVRWPLILHSVVILIPAALWIGSIHADESWVQVLIWIALFLDIFGTPLIMSLRVLSEFGRICQTTTKKIFEYWPGQNIEHRIDRTGAFVTLVFGYSVVSLLYQSSSKIGMNAFFGKAILGLMQAFAFNTLYFEIDSYNLHVHAIRRHFVSATLWITLHLPFILAYVIAGAALSRLVLVDDVSGTSIDDLADISKVQSEPEIAHGLRWFYTAGLGIAMLCLNGIAFCHSFREPSLPPGTRFPALFTRPGRLTFRFAVAFTIIFLGFTDTLSSLKLVATTTGLVLAAGFVELIGNSITGCTRRLKRRNSILSGSTLNDEEKWKHVKMRDWLEALLAEWCEEGHRDACRYRARCQATKRDLEARADEKREHKLRKEAEHAEKAEVLKNVFVS